MLECKICGYTHPTMISASHIKKHDMTTAEYRAKFPEARMRIQSEESKQKIASNKTGKPAHNKGKKVSEAQRQKQSDTMKSKFQSGEIIHWNKGKSLSLDTKEKISVTCKGRKLTDEQKQKHLASIRNWVLSENYASPMAGKTHTPETRLKISQSLSGDSNHRRIDAISKITKICESENLSIVEIEDQWVKLQCNTCKTDFRFTMQMFNDSSDRLSNYCPTCFPRLSGSSNVEKEFADFIEGLGIEIVRNDRSQLGGKEIDVYIPSLKLGFEFTGLYWHSEKQNPQNKHLLWKKQFANTQGIRLITVYEDEWNEKREIVKSRIRHLTGKNQSTKIFARKCQIKVLEASEYLPFLDDTHLQGKMSASIALGLVYENEIVSAMTFRKSSFVKGGSGEEWEISRFASKLNTTVVGAGGKLLKHFRAHHPNATIISYADSRWSDGNVYKSLGFSFAGVSAPSYWYTNDYKTRKHRSSFMKHMLVKKFHADPGLSEWENMQRLGFDRIWDCGTSKWVLK